MHKICLHRRNLAFTSRTLARITFAQDEQYVDNSAPYIADSILSTLVHSYKHLGSLKFCATLFFHLTI